MLIYGLTVSRALESLSTGAINPALAIGAGIAAILAGRLLKAQLGKTHKFAEGGLVLGPTVGMVGEAGPEMIIPLNRANQFLDRQPIDVNVYGKLRGQDIWLSNDRYDSRRGRIGG